MAYNGWANYETWLFNLTVLDGWERDDLLESLGYTKGEDVPDTYDLHLVLEQFFDEYFETFEAPPFIAQWASIAWDEIDWYEIAGHLIPEGLESGFFRQAEVCIA